MTVNGAKYGRVLLKISGESFKGRQDYGIDPDAIDMKMLQPIQGAGHQKLPDIVFAIVVNAGVPVRMPATAWVGIFV